MWLQKQCKDRHGRWTRLYREVFTNLNSKDLDNPIGHAVVFRACGEEVV